jgi:putative nucleotidyltransferase with HDIG domain
MPQMRVLIASRGDRRSAIARALGIHAARPTIEVGGADTRQQLFRELASAPWHTLLIDPAFDGADSSHILAAASERLRGVRVVVLDPAESPQVIADRVRAFVGLKQCVSSAAVDPDTGLPVCDTLVQLLAHDGRRPRTGLLSCIAIHAAATAETARVITDSLGDGGLACRWQGVDIIAIRRASNAGEAFVWAEGLCSRLASASVGLTWVRASDLQETAINQADHALSLAIARGPEEGGAVCTWQTVAALQVARRIAETVPDPLQRRDALLAELSGALGPAQRHHLTSHSEEVAAAAHNLAQLLRLSTAECDLVRLAAIFHDIGKLMIPDDLLAKPGPLSPLQRRVMDRHAAEGAHLCEALGLDPDVSHIVRHHHTRFDARETAPDAARIVAVADAMITMTSTRPYSPARSFSYALAELRRCRGTVFDPKAVIAAHILGASTMAAAA